MNHMNAPGPGEYVPGSHATQRRNDHRTQPDSRNKKRKYVPGGRIPKKRKSRIQEGAADDLYCATCESYFPCASSKASHQDSKKHRDKVAEKHAEDLRNQMESAYEEEAEEDMDMTEEEKKEAQKKRKEEARELERPRAKPLLTNEELRQIPSELESNPHARSFRIWASRSLKAAKPADKQPVYREIAHTYLYHKDQGTLLTTTWATHTLANGKRYLNEHPEALDDLIFTPEQVARMAASAPAPSISTSRTIISTLAESVGPSGSASVNIPTATATPVPGEDDAFDVDMVPRGEPLVPLRQSNITWEVSNAAKTLVTYHSSSPNKMEIVAKFHSRHKNITKKTHDSLAPKGVPDDVRNDLTAKLNDHKAMKESGEYENEEFIASLNKLVDELEAQGGMKRMVRECLFLVVRVVLESGDIDEHHEQACRALGKIMDQFRGMEYSADALSEFIAHWLVSLLYKPVGSPANSGYHLDIVLASIPKFFYKTQGMEYGLNIINSVLNGNHVRFMDVLRSHAIHHEHDGRTIYMLEPIQEFVRQKAFLLLGKSCPAQGFRVVKQKIMLEEVMDQLNYFEIDNEDDSGNQTKRWLREDAIRDLGRAGMVLKGDESYEFLEGIPEDSKVKFNHSVIDVQACCSFLHLKNRFALCLKAK